MSIYFLDGAIAKELDFDLREIFPEKCGLAFGYNIDDASFNCLRALRAQEPRGEKGAGIISQHQGEFFSRRRVGKVSQEFREYGRELCRKEFPGRIVIGHDRYATMGGHNKVANVQPFLFELRCGEVAMGHNGTLYGAEKMRRQLKNSGAVFATNSDTEIFYHYMAKSGERDAEKAILYALKRVQAAYSLVIISQDKSFLIKDYRGTRPLSIAKLRDGYVACSETFAIDQIPGAKYWRDVRPGEMLVFAKNKKPRSVQYARPDPHLCIFEPIYFMRPRSQVNGYYVEDYRYDIGFAMAHDIREKCLELGIDCVVPILDSGEYYSRGLADGLGVEYLEALARTKNFTADVQDRSFTAVTDNERKRIIRGKLNLRANLIKGRRPLAGDDSIVRGNTIRLIVEWIREAEAKTVGVAIGFPPITHPCHGGMAFPTDKELIAHARTIAQIRRKIGSDWLFYLRESTLRRVTADKLGVGICDDCYRCRHF